MQVAIIFLVVLASQLEAAPPTGELPQHTINITLFSWCEWRKTKKKRAVLYINSTKGVAYMSLSFFSN